MTEPVPTRVGNIGEREIRVFDGLLTKQDLHTLVDALDTQLFTRTEVARPDAAQVRHWVYNVEVDSMKDSPLYKLTVDATKLFYGGRDTYDAYRAYCNYSSYGDMLFTHTDAQPGEQELTALWYLAKDWHLEWGGETLFFNEDNDAEFVASPKPGRLVIFDGSITHAGRPPNRICFVPRYTFAFKLERMK